MTIKNPLYLQNKLFPAIQDRALLEALAGGVEQIVGSSSLLPALSSGVTTSVAAGKALVKGDTNSGQGFYLFECSASENQSHTRDATNPRINTLVARVYDSTEVGSGSDGGAVEIVAGTPTPGATLTNLSGLASLPASAMPIAYVLVPTSGDATVKDVRPRMQGKSIVVTEEARTNAAYGLLTTPDVVRGIIMPTDGFIVVTFQAMWKESTDLAAHAGIFLNEVQLQRFYDTGLEDQNAQVFANATNTYRPLLSSPGGLWPDERATVSKRAANSGPNTTGQLIGGYDTSSAVAGAQWFPGGSAHIFAAAGVYDISVRFKATTGSVTVKGRKLWVRTQAFV